LITQLPELIKAGSVSDGRWKIFKPQKKNFQPVAGTSTQNHVIINTSQPVDTSLRQILAKISEE